MASPPETIGRYRIVQRLAQGGMGTLFLAVDPQIDRQVAIKLLRGELADDELRERFLREARTAGRLRHVNIISIFDVGEYDGYPFIAMEYIDGETLAEVIKRRAPLPVARKLEIVEALCSALSYAHRNGIVHRDVKPANVMIDQEGVVKMLDFGIARLTGSGMTQQGAIMGTLNYMSPEQIEGRPADSRSDIFSAGAVLYELLSFRQAFVGDSIGAMLGKILHESPEPLETLVDGLDAGIVAAVRRAMERDPAARYQNAEDMRRDLQAVRFRLAPDHHADALKPAPPPMALPPTMASPAPVAAPPPPAASDTVFLSPVAPRPRPGGAPEVQLLVVRSGDARMNGRVVPIRSASFSIGRSGSCDLSLADRLLSREHAVIEYGTDGFVVRDEGSANGTFLNGRRIKARETEPMYFGAMLQLGETVLSFTLTHDVKLPDLTGCQIAGRYSLLQLMHESAKGAVYTARDDNVAKNIAVKLLSPDLMRFAGYREQFEREAAVGATLHHPYICQVLDRGTAQLSPPKRSPIELNYLCMELMAGGTLQDRILAGPVRLELIASWVERLAEALDYAHRHGVIHGDVKPSVIVFDEDDHVYLTEFAFAQRALNAGGVPAVGAPPYMAPEIWEHGNVTAATDQFALAVVTYYAVTGALPFAGQENPDVRRNNLLLGAVPAHKEAASYREDAVPRGVSDVLTRALARAPEQRFASIREFASAVGAALQGRRRVQGAAHVFLSYQRDGGSGWANYFAKELKDHGIATFLDVQQLDRAGLFPPRLARAIEECDVFVCLLGSTTLQSQWVLEEIRQAHRHNKPMIPIFQEGFNPAAARSAADAAVDALLSYDAVHLFDVRNVHIQHSAQDLATLVKNTVAKLD